MHEQFIMPNSQPTIPVSTKIKWGQTKLKYPDAVVLIKDNNMYFSLERDADIISGTFGFNIKKDGPTSFLQVDAELAHSTYLQKLVVAGYKVVFCD